MDIKQKIYDIYINKGTNIIFSADLGNSYDILNIVNIIGNYIIGIKIHSDIIQNFNEFIIKLLELAKKYNFIIIDDRKFCDIGNTVKLQAENIMKYADLVTVHSISGQSIIDGLKECAIKYNCGLLLIAQMSTDNNLIDKNYTKKTLELAFNNNNCNIIGFISQERLSNNFYHFTPGINNNITTDGIGQKYRSIEDENINTDFLIIGRGIYNSLDQKKAVMEYIPKYILLNEMIDIGIVKYGDFTLKSGEKSNIYVDMRLIMSYPKIFNKMIDFLINLVKKGDYVLCGVPMGAISYVSCMCQKLELPQIIVRKTKKDYGMGNIIEGHTFGKKIIIVEDVITTGSSILEILEILKNESSVEIEEIICILDRGAGGVEKLKKMGYNVKSLYHFNDLI